MTQNSTTRLNARRVACRPFRRIERRRLRLHNAFRIKIDVDKPATRNNDVPGQRRRNVKPGSS